MITGSYTPPPGSPSHLVDFNIVKKLLVNKSYINRSDNYLSSKFNTISRHPLDWMFSKDYVKWLIKNGYDNDPYFNQTIN